MNTVVSAASLATATAVTIPATATASTPTEGLDRQAIIARAEQLVEILGDRVVCAGWHEHFDQRRAAAFLDAVRREDYNAEYGDEATEIVNDWVAGHGQSFDWLYRGDPSGLICRAAHQAFKMSPAANESDPIFAAIEAHEAAVKAFAQAVRENCRLEESLPQECCQSSITAYERKIVETDDPRWIEAEEQVEETGDVMDDAAIKILNLEPATLQGAFAVLRYAVDHIDHHAGEMMGWPDNLLLDGVDPDTAKLNDSRSAEYFLMLIVAVGLERLLSATA